MTTQNSAGQDYSNEADALPDGAGIAEYYAGKGYFDPPYMIANVTLDSGTKSALLAEKIVNKGNKAPFKNH